MEDILIEVYLPVTGKTYDILVPRKSRMYEVTTLVSAALSELSEGIYLPSKDAVLCDRDTGHVFNINLSVEELKLRNGSKLMLI
ncbi:MAG TPA: methyltransferase [Eubacterium sp.]|nr:methyltransferase [Eubacterium sp.]